MPPFTARLCLSAFISVLLAGCGGTQPASSESPAAAESAKPAVPADAEAVAAQAVEPVVAVEEPKPSALESELGAYKPTAVPDGFLALNPRKQTEAEIDAILKDAAVDVQLYKVDSVIQFSLSYPVALNMNPGPPGMRPTSEGGDLRIDIAKVAMSDGTSAVVDRPYGTSQRYQADTQRFRDSREFRMKSPWKPKQFKSVSGEVVFTLPVGTSAFEIVRPADNKVERVTPTEGIRVTPNWTGNSVTVEFEAGSRRKIVHLVGIGESDEELLITSVGGLSRRTKDTLGRHSYLFNGSLQRLQIWVAASFIERRVPFELDTPTKK